MLRRPAERGSVNIHKTSVKVPSFPPYTLERVMTTLSAWKFNALQGAGEAGETEQGFPDQPARRGGGQQEAGRKKPKIVMLPVWRFCEGAHAPRP